MSIEDLRERVVEGRSSLNGGKVEYVDVVRVVKVKNVFVLVEGDSFGDEVDIFVEDIVVVWLEGFLL